MAPSKIVPFHPNLLDEAAALLAARHRRDRQLQPGLPARFAEPAGARQALEAVWQQPQASGVAALSEGRLLGYLIGDVTIDTLRGRSAWVRLAGHALAEEAPASLYRELYAAAAPAWLTAGCFDHYPLVPTTDRAALETWFSLGFGQEQVHGLRPLSEADLAVEPVSDNITIRRATVEDRAVLVEVSPLNARYHAQAPIWAPIPPDYLADLRDGYAELADDEEAAVWLAWQGGQVAGFQCYLPIQPANDDLLTPEGCIELRAATTRPESRGQGIGQALTRHGMAAARRAGYACVMADWRATNLLAARFWPNQGFQPTVYRLARHIDLRIAWAHGNY